MADGIPVVIMPSGGIPVVSMPSGGIPVVSTTAGLGITLAAAGVGMTLVGGVVAPPGIADISRPALLTFNSKWLAIGDSTTFGVGAANGVSDWPAFVRGKASAPIISVTWHGGGANPTPQNVIQNGGLSGDTSGQLLQAAQTNLGSNPGEAAGLNGVWSLGINDYSSAGDRNWPTTVKNNFITYTGLLTGQPILSVGPIPQMGDQPASIYGSDIRYHFLDMRDTFGNRASDLARMMRHARELQGGMAAGTANRIALDFEDIALDYRDDGVTTLFTPLATDAVPQTGTTLPALTFPEGTYFYNTSSTNWYRKRGASGAGSWAPLEATPKHMCPNGYQVMAAVAADYMAAQNGTGPAQPLPDKFRVPYDCAPGTVIGQMRAMGTVTGWGIQSDYAGTFATELAIDASGKITRTATGSLASGRKTYIVAARSALGVLTCPIDLYSSASVSTTTPPPRQIPTPGIVLGSRQSNGIADGTKFSLVYIGTPNIPSGQGYIVYALAPGSKNVLQVYINNSGFFRMALYDASSVMIGTTPTVSVSGLNVAGSTQVAIAASIDIAGGTSSLCFTTAAGDVDKTASMPVLTGIAPMTLSAANWSFLAAGAPKTPLAPITNPLLGGFTRLWMVDDYVDFSGST
jgi:hypothetical protein